MEIGLHHPLKSGKSANHDNPDGQAVPETAKSNVLVDTSNGRSKGFSRLTIGVEFADHDVGRVGDDSTENAGEITSSKGDTGLGSFAVVRFLPWHVVVHCLNDSLERSKLHHGLYRESAISAPWKSEPTGFHTYGI